MIHLLRVFFMLNFAVKQLNIHLSIPYYSPFFKHQIRRFFSQNPIESHTICRVISSLIVAVGLAEMRLRFFCIGCIICCITRRSLDIFRVFDMVKLLQYSGDESFVASGIADFFEIRPGFKGIKAFFFSFVSIIQYLPLFWLIIFEAFKRFK